MAGELAKALSEKIGNNVNSNDLMKAMSTLLILLLKEEIETKEKPDLKDEDDMLMEGMRDRITGRRKFSGLGNKLIPKPM